MLTIVTFFALFGVGFALRVQIAETIRNFGKINSLVLWLIIPLEIINYHGQAKLYQSTFTILGEKIRYKFFYRTALELNFVNAVFPSGGVSGFSYFGLRMRSQGIGAGKATLVQMVRFIMVFVSFQVLLAIGLFFLALGGQANSLLILVAGSISTLLIVGTFAVAYLIGSQKRINKFVTVVTNIINKVVHVFRPSYPETINVQRVQGALTELHENYVHIRSNLKSLRTPLIHSLVANVSEIAVVYVVYIAFGEYVNPGAVIIAYAIANFAGLLSVLPGGIGLYEFLMTAVMAAGGVPASVSLPVTIMYRVLAMSLQLPIGYFLYQRTLNGNGNDNGPDQTTDEKADAKIVQDHNNSDA